MARTFTQRLNGFLTRLAYRAYRRLPLFGRLTGSAAVIHGKDGRFLVVERSDGLGVAFPGGLAWPREAPERTLRREVLEETGLRVVKARFLFAFDDPTGLAASTSVFSATVCGDPRGSWEGDPLWISLEELDTRVLPNQRPIVDYLLRGEPKGGDPETSAAE
jgi:8-oxo-dGTP pyrophosphatase MutT (NUDIX family)